MKIGFPVNLSIFLMLGLFFCFSFFEHAIAQPRFPTHYPSYQVKMDDKRKGWIIGFGGGAGCNIVTPKVTILGKVSYGTIKTNPSMLTDAQLGYNFNDLFEISYINRFDWQMPYSAVITSWTSSIGLRYFLKHDSPSYFFNCSSGYGYWFYPFDPTWNDHYYGKGMSFALGVGYEIKKHLSVNLDFQHFRPTNSGKLISRVNGYEEISDFSQTNVNNAIRLTFWYTIY